MLINPDGLEICIKSWSSIGPYQAVKEGELVHEEIAPSKARTTLEKKIWFLALNHSAASDLRKVVALIFTNLNYIVF